MALDDFEDDYRKKINNEIWQVTPNTGIVGPDGFPANPAPASSPAPKTGGYDLEGFRNRWMQSGNVNDPNAWLQGNQDITQGVTLRNEKAYDPSGKFIADLVGNYSGADPSQRSRIFLDGIGSNGKPRTAGTKATTAAATAGTKSGSGTTSTFTNDIRKLITEQLAGLKGTPSINDPTLAAQSQAYRRASDRGVAEDRAMMAERAAANGTLQGGQSSGGFDTDLLGLRERANEDAAGYDAKLVGDEVQSRRATVNSLLNMALQSGDAESTRMLQMELARLDAQIRREGLAQDASQFNANLNQQQYMYDDTRGYQIGRDAERDYINRYMLGLGG